MNTNGPTKSSTPQGEATRTLERVRNRIRNVAVSERLLAGLSGVGAWVLGAGLLDFLLRLPGWLRLIALMVGLSVLLVTIWRHLIPAIRLRPKLTTIALRLERSELGAERDLRGVLASGVALASERSGDEPESIAHLRARATATANTRIVGAEPWKLVDTSIARRRGIWAGIVLVSIAGFAAFAPSVAMTGLSRQFAPLGDATWPTRFAVIDATTLEVHPLGTALPIRALVTKTTRGIGQTPVTIAYRIVDANGDGPIRREPLSPQRIYELTNTGSEGEAYERLVELPLIASNDDRPARLEYSLETPDSRTELATILLVEQPEIVDVKVTVTPPAYATASAGTFAAGTIDMSDTGRDRGLVGPVLAGSEVQLEAILNKPATPSSPEPLREIESDSPPADVEISSADNAATISWTATASARLTLGIRDRFEVQSLEDTVVRFDVIQDAPPRITVAEPARDESVLATAVVDLAVEGRDDVSLGWVAIEYERAVVPSGSAGAQPEGTGELIEIARVVSNELRSSASAVLDISTIGVTPGDAIDIYGVAVDTYEVDGVPRAPVRSDHRRLRIISESELIDEVLSELGSVRRTAIRLDEQQAEISNELATSEGERSQTRDELAQRQANISESLVAAAESVDRAADRLERNGLEDEALSRVVRDAAEAADRGARAAEAAAAELNDAEQAEDPEQVREASERAERQSDEVRRALEDLARTLDQGEDAWSVRRSLEGIVRDQSTLSQETAEAGAQTVGRSGDELTEEERSVLDDIARRQLDLAERAAELLDELEDRAEQSAEQDPGQSAAMRAASRRGREQGVSQLLRDASRAVSQNRAAEAGRSQQQAQEQLEEMLNDLEAAERQRDAELQRALLSLVETIEALIRTQESEIARLQARDPDLATGMSRLHRNTLAALDEARADSAMALVAEPLGAAADAQASAVVVLRADIPGFDAAEHAELRSLAQLTLALEAAQEALNDAQRREQDRKREELKAAYRAALESQVRITVETAAFDGERLSRRERAALRSLGSEEDTLRAEINALQEIFPELTETMVFDLAHSKLDTSLDRAGQAMREGDAGPEVLLEQASIENVLRGLISALDPPEQGEEQDFAANGGGGGGNQQSGDQPLIPPIAELQMLRSLQQDIYDRTRAVQDAQLTGPIVDRIGVEQSDLANQARALLQAMQQQQAGAAPVQEGE